LRNCNITAGEKMTAEERLVTIETKIAYLENYVNELNQVIIDQEEAIKKLNTETEMLKKKIEQGEGEKLPENEKPPHY
jgi:SlyX protein